MREHLPEMLNLRLPVFATNALKLVAKLPDDTFHNDPPIVLLYTEDAIKQAGHFNLFINRSSQTLSSSPNLVQSKSIVDPCSREDGDQPASTSKYINQSVLYSDHADIKRYLTQNHIRKDEEFDIVCLCIAKTAEIISLEISRRCRCQAQRNNMPADTPTQ